MRTWLSAVLLLFALAPFSHGQGVPTEKIPDRNIVGGLNAPSGRFPYVCSIRRGRAYSFVCTGVLASPQVVLTAAHCIYTLGDPYIYANPVVFCGHLYIDIPVRQLIFNSQARLKSCYGGDPEYGCDIAVLVLSRPAPLTPPQLPLPYSDVPTGVDLTALGWGWYSYEEKRAASYLQMANHFRVCGQIFPSASLAPTPAKLAICTECATEDLCRGDSGGPLLIPDAPDGRIENGNPAKDVLVGLDSYGSRECDSSRPQVFTKVSAFVNRVEQIIAYVENKNAADTMTATT